ncbi:uncharacterized protein A4U43_C05F26120 [Asparagus officinalis]|uniref:Pentacotripeptide-repeat region of PRORP domain-containing protein n=1 Tax=Asparagus officinalis TaxID=4686 RepID=A0A5P1EZZ0_ASPOF|nr:uncharacterized protein A4U43_C05F26120 [Asparagus officinalis]
MPLSISIPPPAKTITSLLLRFSKTHLPILTAYLIQAQIIKSKSNSDPFAYNVIISSFLASNQLESARKLFEEMPERNIVTYTTIVDAHMKCGLVSDALIYFRRNPFQSVISYTAVINGLVRNGLGLRALLLFKEMLCDGLMPNEITFTTIIRACIISAYDHVYMLPMGKSIVGLIVKTNFEKHVSVCNSLITMFSKMREVDNAKRVFDEMIVRDVISWTALLDFYFEVGDLKEARQVFDSMPERNEISWSTMIARLSQNDESLEALRFFYRMVHDGYKPNVSCFASVLSASASSTSLQFGSNVHSLVVKFGMENDNFVASSLIDMYSKCRKSQYGRQVFDFVLDKNIVVWNTMLGGYSFDGRVEDAEDIFEQMPARNIVSWNAMISGYDLNERYGKVLETFDAMLFSGQVPMGMTFSSVIHSCANLPSLEKGKNLHGKILKLGLENEVFVGTSLLDMYSKSGDVESSKKIFSKMPQKNEVSWTAMIQGLADSGCVNESIELFERMKETNIIPTETMFLSILFACSHCGLLDRGLHYFESMKKEYGIFPNERHYTCMVDLLSRAGLLREAEEFIGRMPVEPEANTWAALLSGSCTFRNEEIGERAAKKLLFRIYMLQLGDGRKLQR